MSPTTEQFRLAIEASPTGMILLDDRGRIVLVNSHVEQLFGYSRDEVIGQPIDMLVPERLRTADLSLPAAFFHSPGPVGAGRDFFGLRKDGSEVPIEIGLNPLETPQGRFLLSSVADISERKRGERERERLVSQLRTLNAELEDRVLARTVELRAALRERDVLLQEVHHRVKNNLQVISSLISMQVRSLGAGASRDALEDCRTRVQAIALIHDQLYRSKDYACVPFSEYARTLAGNVFEATGAFPGNVALDLAIQDVALAVDKAIPCGLILNELITNALKHAFPGHRPGTIRVELGPIDGGGLRLEVSDDGRGLPAGFDVHAAPSVGLQLVRMLAKQLGAGLEMEGARGMRVSLTVPTAE
jgi:PAS domain S-box-containing protein